jgi:hypothetical protein
LWLKVTDTVPPETVIDPRSTLTCAGHPELAEWAAMSFLLEELLGEALAVCTALASRKAAATTDADPNARR